MDHVAQFADLMASPRPRLDLALALIAAAGRTDLEPRAVLERLDALAELVGPGDAAHLCDALFSAEGPVRLGGDRADYYDPRNSLIDQVLERRRGIPITLSVIGMEVARRRGTELEGIGMPGHFLLGERTSGTFFDAFDGGRSMGPDGAAALFHALHGPEQHFEAVYLAPTPPVMIVARVLNNLRAARGRRGDRAALATTLRLQASLPGDTAAVRRDLAALLAADGRFLDAASLYDDLAADDPATGDEHRATARRLRARLN